MSTQFYILFVILYAISTVSAHRRDSSEEEDLHHVSNRPIPCGGSTINLGELELERRAEIEECLDIKLVDAIELLNSSPRRSERRQVRNERRIMRILRRECSAECTWQAFGLIATEDSDASFHYSDEVEKFSNLFPEKARIPVKTGVEACLNATSHRQHTIDYYFRPRHACDENRRLVECLQRAVAQGCRSRARGNKHVSTTAKPVEMDESTTITTSTTLATSASTMRPDKENKREEIGGEGEPDEDDEDNGNNLIKP